MDQDPVVASRSSSWLSLLLLPILFFLLGLGAMAWLLVNWDYGAQTLGLERAGSRPAVPSVVVRQPQGTVPATATPVVVAPASDAQRRLEAIEQRIGLIEQQSRNAVGNADRAEGLLVAFAARRALDRGVALGYLERLLTERFGSTQRQAVATVITAARQPITLQELQAGLAEVAPKLTGASPRQGWWDALRGEVGSLVTLRRAGTPSTMPAERLRRATQRLESGEVDVALAEVLRLPGRDNAQAWIDSARNYVRARRALDAIETAALLDPQHGGAPTV